MCYEALSPVSFQARFAGAPGTQFLQFPWAGGIRGILSFGTPGGCLAVTVPGLCSGARWVWVLITFPVIEILRSGSGFRKPVLREHVLLRLADSAFCVYSGDQGTGNDRRYRCLFS